jgi:hypothetical protein
MGGGEGALLKEAAAKSELFPGTRCIRLCQNFWQGVNCLNPPIMKTPFLLCLVLIFHNIGNMIVFAADEKPPGELFAHSNFDFAVTKLDSLGPPRGESGYRSSELGKVPFRTMYWTNRGDYIALDWLVVPQASWRSNSPVQMFAGAKNAHMTKGKCMLVSERDYELDACRAHSFVFAVGEKPTFMRMDYFLARPDAYILVYGSTNRAALDSSFCKELFDSVSIKAKKILN